jgi:hypothetical protein
MKKTLFPLLALVSTSLFGQQKFVSTFQFSLAPGLSTNGLHPGGFKNYVSINLTSGYSSANYLFEAALISNLNETETRGLQLAGLANLTGANAFAGMLPKEIDKTKKQGFEANLNGIQISGLANIVLNNVTGAQFTGGLNVVNNGLIGLQVAGIGNTVKKYSFGVQLAGVYNISAESVDGVQISAAMNFTTAEMIGVQLGAYNHAGSIYGVNSFPATKSTGFQLGLINKCSTMNGYQIGLINVSRSMQGTQIGIINVFRNGKNPNTRDGTSIGLINIGSTGFLSVYASDMFYKNIEVATGTVKNRRISTDGREKQIQNGLIYSKGGGFIHRQNLWALGYSLNKYYFNRSLTPGHGHFNFFAAGMSVHHISFEPKLERNLSLLLRPNISVGSRIHPRNKVFFFFASVAYNLYKSASGNLIHASENVTDRNYRLQHWPGYSLGVLIQ